MKLIIVESPHKATTISKYLGSDYKVIASKGHVRDLPPKRTGVDVNNNFKPEYELNADKVDIVKKIKQEVAKADKVFLAGDPDREGEAISWHLAEVCGVKGNDIRIEFNEISKKAVEKALTQPRAINMNLVDAQQARRVLDRLVGYELSPIIAKRIKGGSSAGRVQSVALKMIVDREIEIREFKPEEYWTISAFIAENEKAKTNKCELNSINGKKVKVSNKEQADSVIAGSKAGAWSVKTVKRAPSLSKAPAPFTTSTMQQEAISKLGFTSAQVTKIAQMLYEGVEIQGMGQVALVTYIRTDSVRISSEAQQEALNFISNNYGKEYMPKKPNVYSTKEGAQDAHEAIRPITVDMVPQDLKDRMDRDSWRLYNLVYNRFLASQMAPAVYDTLTVNVISQNGDTEYGYVLKGKTCTFKGHTAVYSSTDEKENAKVLPNFTEGEKLIAQDVQGEQKFTKPPQRYNDGTFIKAMEDNGIGRPSTYEKIFSVLLFRKYIARDAKFIVPTELGELVCKELESDFPKIMDTKFTADMEGNLDKIEGGNVKWYQVLKDFYPTFHEKVLEVRQETKKMAPKAQETDIICEKCGAKMVIKQGRYGEFLACPNYPKCSNTKPLNAPVATCPKCGSPIYKRTGKTGKPYYACSGYPKCKFISWDLPAPVFCPTCGSTMKIVVNKDTGEKTYVCTERTCQMTITPKE